MGLKLEKKQTTTRNPGEIDAKLTMLAEMLRQQDSQCWKIGDVVADLLDRHRLKLFQISAEVGYSKARLSEFHLTSRTFPPCQRDVGSFYDSLMARRVWKAIPRLEMSPMAIRSEIIKLHGKRHRQIRAYFVNILLERERKDSIKAAGVIVNSRGGLINRAHHGDWRDVVPNLPDDSVKVFLCDPPFGGYSWRDDGGYMSSRADANGLRTESDNNSEEQALAVTLPLFKTCLPKLAPGGCLLLFQAGGKADRAEVLAEAAEAGWDCLYGLTWQKNTHTPSDCAYPYAPSTERILVFVRRGDHLEWHESGLPRSDVLHFPSETPGLTMKMIRGQRKLGSFHMFRSQTSYVNFSFASIHIAGIWW